MDVKISSRACDRETETERGGEAVLKAENRKRERKREEGEGEGRKAAAIKRVIA